MDINLARTFLTVAETGSFIDAARQLSITQSTVSARIRSLEEQLDRELFERSKSGAELTSAGEQFQKHALALVRVWQTAQIEVSKTDAHRDRLSVGAPASLWHGYLLKWVAWLRGNITDIAVEGYSQSLSVLTQRMREGSLDMAIVYRPVQVPGIELEHLFDEEFVLVTSLKAGARERSTDYVMFDWGAEFELEHAAAFPDHANPGLTLDIGALGVDYLLSTPASGYLPWRIARPYVSRGRLRVRQRARQFVYPVYMLYPEARDEDAFEPILEALRRQSTQLRLNGLRAGRN